MKPVVKKDSLSRGTVIGLLADGLILPTGIISAALLTRNLGVEQYGFIGVAVATFSMVAWIVTSVVGLRSGIKIIAASDDPNDAARAILRLNLIMGLVVSVTFAGSARWISHLLSRPEIETALMLGAAEIFLMPIARCHRDYLLASQAYVSAGLASGIFHVTRLLGIVLFLLLGFAVETVICAIIVARVAEILWCRSKLPIPLMGKSALQIKDMLRIIGPVFLYSLSMRAFGSIDILVLSARGANPVALSHYTAAQTFSQIPGILNLVVVPPLIAALGVSGRAGNLHLKQQIEGDGIRLLAVFSGFILVAAGSAGTLLTTLFGRPFSDASLILSLLLVTGTATLWISYSSARLMEQGRTYVTLSIVLPMLLVALVGWWVFVPQFGAEGAASVSAVAAVLSAILITALLQNGRLFVLRVLGMALASGAIGGLLSARLQGMWFLGADVLAGSLVAAVLMVAVGVIDLAAAKRFTTGMRYNARSPD